MKRGMVKMGEKIILAIVFALWSILGSITLNKEEISKGSYAALLIAYLCLLICEAVK